MFTCSDFLGDFSDYRDGLMDPARRQEVEAHLAECSSCSRYERVVSRGVRELNALPRMDPSSDFIPRLQYRLYQLEHSEALAARGNGSATSAALVVMIALLMGSAAWIPVLTSRSPTVELPPVTAAAPRKPDPLHALFRPGPLLDPPSQPELLRGSIATTVFSRYTPLGVQSYQASLELGR